MKHLLRRNRIVLSFGRRGVAPLELVVALPLLVLMAALIINAGAAGVGVGEALIAARTAAFHEAEAPTSKAGHFLFVAALTAQDVRSVARTRQVAVPPALGTSTLTGNGRLAVLRNTWCSPELNLNRQVSLQLIGQAAAAGGARDVSGALNQIQSALQSAAGALDGLGGLLGQVGQLPAAVEQAREEAERLKEQAQGEIDKLQDMVKSLQSRLDQTKADLEKNKTASEDARRDLKDQPDKLKEREKELNAEQDRLAKMRDDLDSQIKGKNFDIDALKKANP